LHVFENRVNFFHQINKRKSEMANIDKVKEDLSRVLDGLDLIRALVSRTGTSSYSVVKLMLILKEVLVELDTPHQPFDQPSGDLEQTKTNLKRIEKELDHIEGFAYGLDASDETKNYLIVKVRNIYTYANTIYNIHIKETE